MVTFCNLHIYIKMKKLGPGEVVHRIMYWKFKLEVRVVKFIVE